MTEAQKILCDGAVMAYRDTAEQIRDMTERAPAEIADLMSGLQPIAAACETKAVEVYMECERFMRGYPFTGLICTSVA